MIVCFIGHRTIERSEGLLTSLKQTIVELINKGASTFLFGSMSAFDNLSWEAVTQLKVQYPFIKRVYVRAVYPYIEPAYKQYLLERYEETYFSAKLENAGKYAYVERNCDMIDKSEYCVFYYNENYRAVRNRQTNGNAVLPSIRNSGTKIAYQYAVKKKKKIINLYKQG